MVIVLEIHGRVQGFAIEDFEGFHIRVEGVGLRGLRDRVNFLVRFRVEGLGFRAQISGIRVKG